MVGLDDFVFILQGEKENGVNSVYLGHMGACMRVYLTLSPYIANY